jgi:anti-sigma regulatory factor (Ser/Thr protein kinase)
MQRKGREVRHRHRFVPEPGAAHSARRALDGLVPELGADLVRAVQLLATELIGNAVTHAGLGGRGLIDLEVLVDADRVRVVVADGGRGFEPQAHVIDPQDHRGRGLQLVEHVADRWGVQNHGKNRVWFEIDRLVETGGEGSAYMPVAAEPSTSRRCE